MTIARRCFPQDHVFAQDNDGGTLDVSDIRASIESVLAPAPASANPIGAQVAAIEAAVQLSAREKHARRIAEARLKGFEGDSCGACGNFTLVRSGAGMTCNTCGGS